MSRRTRQDNPDTWQHVMNRGIARRPILETDLDRRVFLALLTREVRAGRIEIAAYCLMLTHYHLLLRSVTGELSEAMRRIQNGYSRWFNRGRERDGPLFKGRFLSCLVDTISYRRNVATYIHDNAVHAGLVGDPAAYEWSSACHYSRTKRPPWLETSWVDSEMDARGEGETRGERLATAFPSRANKDFRTWIEKRLSQRLPDELADATLKHAGSPRVVRWAFRKAKLADGTRPFQTVCPSGLVDRALQKARKRVGPLLGRFARKTKDAWICLKAALLRVLAGCAHREIGMRIGRHASTISRDVRDHRRLLKSDPAYEELASRLAHQILASAR